MSIRMRLLLSYAAMLVVPLMLILLTAMLLVVVFRGDLQNMRQMYGQQAAALAERPDERLAREIDRTAGISPAQLEDRAYLDDLVKELDGTHSGLIVRVGKQVIYASSFADRPDLMVKLPPFDHTGHHEGERVETSKGPLTLRQTDFTDPQQRSGSVFLVTAINPFANFARKFFPILFLSVLIILVLTHTLLTYFVSRSIIRPLRVLQKAAEQIKEGDLESRVSVSGKDEIGRLGLAFEEMRVQLRESIGTQLQYEENRKELIASISHDLKTPLTAIRGYVDGIQDGVADTPEKWQRYLRTISTKAEEMDRLIEELLLYSKLDLRRLPFQFERVEMGAFLADCLEELQFDLEKKGFRFDGVSRLDGDVWAAVDRDKLKRVIGNVVDNCIKYADKMDKTIRILVWREGDRVTMSIADNGPGIEPGALPYIFDRFYRAEQSRNSQSGGSGLGLAIAKQIMEGHGGRIEASSRPGEGTKITISLPIIGEAGGRHKDDHPDH